MFEDSAPTPQIGRERAKPAPFNWASLPQSDLIRYYDEIKQHLPATSLKDVNLEEELLLQFATLRKLQGEVLDDESIPLNQRAQVANTVGNAIDRLVEAQAKVYSQERFKAIETVLIRHLKKLPEDVAEGFLADYRVILEGLK